MDDLYPWHEPEPDECPDQYGHFHDGLAYHVHYIDGDITFHPNFLPPVVVVRTA